MTKKIFSLLLVSFATCAVMAQLPQRVEGNPDQRNDESMRFAPMEKQSAAPAGELKDNFSRLMERNPLVDELSKVSLHEVAFPVYKTPSANDETKAFYWKPEGTYFIGIDHNLEHGWIKMSKHGRSKVEVQTIKIFLSRHTFQV